MRVIILESEENKKLLKKLSLDLKKISKDKDLISIKRKISELEKSKEKNDLINYQIEDLINLSIPIKEKIFHEKVICMMKASKKHAVLKSTVNKILYLKYDINFDY